MLGAEILPKSCQNHEQKHQNIDQNSKLEAKERTNTFFGRHNIDLGGQRFDFECQGSDFGGHLIDFGSPNGAISGLHLSGVS